MYFLSVGSWQEFGEGILPKGHTVETKETVIAERIGRQTMLQENLFQEENYGFGSKKSRPGSFLAERSRSPGSSGRRSPAELADEIKMLERISHAEYTMKRSPGSSGRRSPSEIAQEISILERQSSHSENTMKSLDNNRLLNGHTSSTAQMSSANLSSSSLKTSTVWRQHIHAHDTDLVQQASAVPRASMESLHSLPNRPNSSYSQRSPTVFSVHADTSLHLEHAHEDYRAWHSTHASTSHEFTLRSASRSPPRHPSKSTSASPPSSFSSFSANNSWIIPPSSSSQNKQITHSMDWRSSVAGRLGDVPLDVLRQHAPVIIARTQKPDTRDRHVLCSTLMVSRGSLASYTHTAPSLSPISKQLSPAGAANNSSPPRTSPQTTSNDGQSWSVFVTKKGTTARSQSAHERVDKLLTQHFSVRIPSPSPDAETHLE